MEEHLTNWSLILLVDYCAYLLPCTSLSIYLSYKRKNILKLLLLNEVSSVLAFALHGKGIAGVMRKATGSIKWVRVIMRKVT